MSTKKTSKVERRMSIVQSNNDSWELTPRVIIASIPVLGPAATVLIDRYISDRFEKRIIELFEHLADQLDNNQQLIESLSDDVMDFTVSRLHATSEVWKPGIFAKILSDKTADTSDVFRKLLIDHASQLTDYDYLNFIRIAAPELEADLSYNLDTLESQLPELELVKSASLRKLVFLGILASDQKSTITSYSATNVGSRLVRIIK